MSIQTYDNSLKPIFDPVNDFFVTLNIFIIVLVSITSLFFFFLFFKKRQEIAMRILIAVFILSGILSTLLFTKLIFTYLGFESPLILIVVAIITYIGAYFAYLVIVDVLSNRVKNILFVVCSGALGAFVGVVLPSLPIMGISLFLSFADLFLINRKTVEKIVGEVAYERLITEITFSNREWGIGIGDLTSYSIVVANTSVNFGIIAGFFSLFMILIGSFLSYVITLKQGRFPGLPITMVLGLIPLIILSFF
ncbi:hypothetical protein ACFLRN_09850 [Thermoproteota archaeon]